MTLDPCPKCGKRVGDKHKVPFVEAYRCGRTIYNRRVREALLFHEERYKPRKKRSRKLPPPPPPPQEITQHEDTTELELDIFSCIDLDLTALLTPPYYPIES